MRPIRVKGYWRAVRRGDKWATDIEKLRAKGGLTFLMAFTYRTVELDKLIPLYAEELNKIKPTKEKQGDYYTVPVLLGKDSGFGVDD